MSQRHRIAFVPILLLFSGKVTSGVSADTISLDSCGQRTALTKQLVSHGDQSRLGEWPWHAAILQRMNRSAPIYACGGTIITASSILTAAHCTYPPTRVRLLNPSELLVRAGISNLQQADHSLQQMTVEKIVVHEDYHSDAFVNDIALLKLSWKFEFTDYVKPICLWRDLADEKLIVGKLGYVAGWGRDERGELPDQLQHAAMPIVAREACRDSDRKYYTTYLFNWKCFCAGYRNGTSPGTGDSGGGLYIELDGKWILRGVVSNGKFNRARQLDTFSYIVFADVAHFIPWINNKTGRVSNLKAVRPVAKYSTCGQGNIRQYSQAGVAEERMWPWDGDVYREGQKLSWLCQTAVINENFVLSPAAPYSDSDVEDPSNIIVVFTRNETKQVHQVKSITRSPDYVGKIRSSTLALLELKVPLLFSDLIRPICLWNTSKAGLMPPGDWYTYNTCVTKFKATRTSLPKFELCNFGGTTEKAIPDFLYVEYANSWYLRGVTSAPMKGLKKESADFYIGATHYSNWIEKNAVVTSKNLFNHVHCESKNSWIYKIMFQDSFQCFGSLILPSFLLTVASCVDAKSKEDLSIWQYGIQTETKVENIYLHPAFDNVHLTNNIAVVEITPFKSSTPLCIPKSNISLPHFKLLRLVSIEHNTPSKQLATAAPVESCAERWQREGVRVSPNRQHICADILNSRFIRFNCTADLHGAPLVHSSEDGSYVVGLLDTSKKDYCKNADLPKVFTDVMFYVDWISTFASKKLAPRMEALIEPVLSASKQSESTTPWVWS